MNRRMSLAVLTSVMLMSLLAAAQQPARTTSDSELEKIKTPPLPEFHPQIPKRVVLPNGMVLLLQEDHELPLIDGTMRIRGGSLVEPAD